jgi:hypothetical protein
MVGSTVNEIRNEDYIASIEVGYVMLKDMPVFVQLSGVHLRAM